MARDHEIRMIEVNAEITKAKNSSEAFRALLDSRRMQLFHTPR